ncbi:MAG: CHRD domain-containing protein [Actinomycetota bacterium]
MRKLAVGVCVSLVALMLVPIVVSQASSDGPRGPFNARLKGFNEVPAVSTEATGRFSARVDRGAEEIAFRLEYEDLEGEVLFAHIHLGQRDVNGGVITFLCGGGGFDDCPQEGTVTGVIEASDIIGPSGQGIAAGEFDEVVDAMMAGVTYANVHSDKFPGGEIRGQIRRP